MPRRLPDGTDALSQSEMYGNTYITCRHRAGTLDDADKSIPLDLIHSSPVAVCSSSASATNKIATVDNYPDYSLVNGKEVVVYMQNGNSATNPTMNINNTGAIQMDFSDWSAGTFIKLKYIDITVGGQRIQKYLVDVGAYNNKQSVDNAIDNSLKVTNITSATKDINTLIGDRLFFEQTYNVLGSCPNMPIVKGGRITVLRTYFGSATNQYLLQKYEKCTSDNDTEIWLRVGRSIDGGTTWTFLTWQKVATESDLASYIKSKEITLNFSIPNGDIGTRGNQINITTDFGGDISKIISMEVTNISNSSAFYPVLFSSGDTLYCNIYRCQSSFSGNYSVKIKISYL